MISLFMSVFFISLYMWCGYLFWGVSISFIFKKVEELLGNSHLVSVYPPFTFLFH